MNPGKLNKRIKFHGMDMEHKNQAGEIEPKLEILFSRWGNYKSISSAPTTIGEKQYMKTSAEIIVRFTKKITDDMSVSISDTIMDIDAIENVDEVGKWLKIYCSVVV